MVVPSNTPAFVLPTAASGVSATDSTANTNSAASLSSSASSFSSSSLSSNTAASSISNASSIEPGLVSKPTLQTSTVLGLVEERTDTSKPETPERPERPETPKRPDRLERPELPERTERPERPDKPLSRPPSPGITRMPLREPPPPPKTPSTNTATSTDTTSNNMPSRPSTTSGGALSRPTDFNRRISRDDMFLGSQLKISTAAFDQRISRDDLYLGTRPSAARSGVFHMPLRAEPATIEEGSSSSVDLGIVPPPAAWPESLMSSEVQIGMALGSPIRTSPPEQLVSFRQQQRVQAERMQRYAEPATYASWQPNESAQTHNSSEQPTASNDAPLQRSKTTRRKLFGIFGSKRHQDPVKSTLTSTSSAYSLEASDASSVVMTAALPAAERPAMRSGNRKHQPIIVQIVPEPATATNIKASNGSPSLSSASSAFASMQPSVPGPAPNIKEGRNMRPFLRSKASEPAIHKKLEISNPMHLGLGNSTMTNPGGMNMNPGMPAPASGNSSYLMPPPMLGASPYLDVEIPEARMERYSVMFSSLLGSGPSWQPASSLLARRQATLDKLKTINDRIHQEDLERNYVAAAAADAMVTINGLPSPGLQRRATSPHVTRSPAFSLFPGRSPSASHAHNPLPSPRLRSNTSPVATRSPMRAGYDFLQPPGMASAQQQQQQQQQRYNGNPHRANPPSVVNRKPPAKSNTMPVSITATAPAASSPAARSVIQFDPMQSNFILDSPIEMDDPAEQLQQPFKPVIQEPQWQMISPPSSTGSMSSSSRSGGSSKASGSSSNVSPASTASLEFDVDEPDKELKSAVEISIARQISISRQQRQLLRPLKTNSLAPLQPLLDAIPAGNTPISATSLPSRSATLKLGRNERLQETKTSTPTLVVAPSSVLTDDRSQASAPGSLAAHQQKEQQQQRSRYLSPRSNAHANSNLQAYQLAQNRKSERVILEAA